MSVAMTRSHALATMWAHTNALHQIHGTYTSPYARNFAQATPIAVGNVQDFSSP